MSDVVRTASTDRDGFYLYACAQCHATKISALFLPTEIKKDDPVCRACLGEISLRSIKARKDTRPKSFLNSLKVRTAYRKVGAIHL